MEGYLMEIYKHKLLATAQARDMIRIVLETALDWHDKYNENPIIKQIIQVANKVAKRVPTDRGNV